MKTNGTFCIWFGIYNYKYSVKPTPLSDRGRAMAPRHIVPRQTVPRQKGPRKLSRDRLSRDQKSPRTKCPMNQNVPETKMSHELNYPKLRFLMSAFWPKPTLQLDLANDDEWPPSRFRCQKCAIGHGTFGLDISRSTWHLPSPARCNVKI